MTQRTLAIQPWLSEALQQLDDLAKLGPDWDSYGGKPLQPGIREFTTELLRSLESESLPVPGMVLGSAGTVQLEWRLDNKELEVEILGPGRFGFLKVHPDGQMEEGEVSQDLPDALRHLIRWLVRP